MICRTLCHKKFLDASNGEGNGTPLQYSCLENPMDGGAWWAAVHGVAKSWTQLSEFTFTFHFHALEKEMATNSSVLAWRIPGTGEPGGLPSMGPQSRTWLKRLSSSSRRVQFGTTIFLKQFIVFDRVEQIYKSTLEKLTHKFKMQYLRITLMTWHVAEKAIHISIVRWAVR